MSLTHTAVVIAFKAITTAICRIDATQLAQVPEKGPLIIVMNHVNIVEIPIIYTRLQPRPVTGMALADRWENPFLGWLFDVTGTIPLHRGEADIAAIRKALERLEAGDILIIDPEGTRSKDGRLQRGHPGAVLLALRSGAPLLPVVHYGSEHYGDNLRRLRRSDFKILVGRPFRIDPGAIRVTSDVRQKMVDEIMYQMAQLLPAKYRGYYSDLTATTDQYLDFV